MATSQHFASAKYPIGMYVISILSLGGLFTFLYHAFFEQLAYTLVSLVLTVVAFALFIWAIRHSREKRLSLAFDEEQKIDGIITTGPWRYVRHPFYVSYTMFWLGGALGTLHMASIAVAASLLFIYTYSAWREEKALKVGAFGQDYVTYREKAGFFLPKLVSRG
ncbi:hypothetical protein OG2516_06916 [Oceanicola granulosus HTCC2516]|uniref:Isoprenylcysteine carboxyl methyltransferase family protein n=1 Tax=Oceanicola granulosus (strain ATCC BAA-861 / DSM 15982 / KCTC 12143 / HTCC2516) TaxID=314256 RepID=Q2CGE3_OCEGH|nr:methyltransferase [Oceanicola granulosus]EAR51775.1 hypothetical protein OG2516_06916 [Oceanicola granulosus HTCC2516]